MININKEIFKKALLAGIFSAFTIGVLTILTYKSALGLFIAGSFGSSMVLLFGFPESPFAQPKNVFFGHLVTALVGVVFVTLVPLPMFINIALAVGVGIFLMILLNIVHPPAGGCTTFKSIIKKIPTPTASAIFMYIGRGIIDTKNTPTSAVTRCPKKTFFG